MQNRVIAVSGIGARSGFSALMSDKIPCLDMIEKGQCFPLYLYEEESQPSNQDAFDFEDRSSGLKRRDAITKEGLSHFQSFYGDAGKNITKEDIFYYIYGLLHSPEYVQQFQNDLTKNLPRIPRVKTFMDFMAFAKAGRELGDLHVNFESIDPYLVTIKEGDLDLAHIEDPQKYFRVEKMKHGGAGKEKDKTTVHYNPRITMTNIPLKAYDYIVNGRPALEWVMERQTVKTDKASGIINDANDYANETMNDPQYPLKLFQRIITLSLKTLDIIDNLPKLEIEDV